MSTSCWSEEAEAVSEEAVKRYVGRVRDRHVTLTEQFAKLSQVGGHDLEIFP